ncbi:response regulator [Planktothrix pseudagardhii]|uniref:Response regulator rcp1 n=1 Tax=Planktothrix pseudagardhii TaxID=132604 RepID=A0A9W4G6J9_9CYAN|nr:response regulator [Planktothrix pseudagardhii]CAD5946733.1 Response regulator rcp1 [Planktothrix pseudagardhii]
MQYQRTILVVEDSDEDFTAFKRVMRQLSYSNRIYRVMDGDDALAYLYHQDHYSNPDIAPVPDLILLDLNLPGTDGREVIYQVKQDKLLSI